MKCLEAKVTRLTKPMEDERLKEIEGFYDDPAAWTTQRNLFAIRDLLAEVKRLRAGEDTLMLDKLLAEINGYDDNPMRNIFGEADGEGELDRDWIRAQIEAEWAKVLKAHEDVHGDRQ